VFSITEYILVCLVKGSRIGNRITKEQGKGIIQKRQNPKTRQNRDNTHEHDKRHGYIKNNRAQRIKMYMNKTTQKLKHLQYEPPQKTGAPER
jgi:hypothetical protein